VDFSLVVADCFHGDTVAIAVNGQDLLTAATADFSSGKTGISVYLDRQGLWVRHADNLSLIM
jgi:hypothetical protein